MRKPVENLKPDFDRSLDRLLSRYGELWADSASAREEDLADRFRERLSRAAARKSKTEDAPKWTGTYGWLLAAACILGLFMAPSYFDRQIGAIVFSTGDVSVVGNPTDGTQLFAAATVEVSEGQEAMLSLDGDRINLFLNEDSRLTLDSKDTVTLAQGEVWVRVEPNSGYFGIVTPHGVVEVHGTTFGITADESETRVEIAAGKVAVANAKGEVFVEPGRGARIAEEGEAPSLHSTAGDVTPQWARDLFNRASLARERTFFPSAAP